MRLRPFGALSSGLAMLALGGRPAFADGMADQPPAHPKDAAPAPSAAPRAYSTEVLVLHATNTKKGIDPRIGDMPELKKIPFSSYDSYELLQRVRLPLKKDEPKTFDLPNGRVLQTKLVEVLPDGSVRLSASINQPGGKTFLPLLEVKAKVGQAFIVAGQSYKGGILVLVVHVLG
ncbi:MAG TPA: hypothetical protein VH062_11345 [Polyangiaceae bacterium]|jgi:hypothetical protein|nr:hypothetical protein [Polyangiaceae bacterium]